MGLARPSRGEAEPFSPDPMSTPREGRRGYKQSPEHIARRVASVAAVKGLWTAEKKAAVAAKVRAANVLGRPEIKRRAKEANAARPPWNKGNNWRSRLSAEELRAYNAKRAAARRRRNGRVVMNERFSALIRHHLKVRAGSKNRTPWPELVGYGPSELEAHLRSTIPPGFDWDDYLTGRLHLDHIIPVAAHNFTSVRDLDFQRCWALSNLRLIEKFDNLRKGARLAEPFQPSLAI